jgi:hypothetical protein
MQAFVFLSWKVPALSGTSGPPEQREEKRGGRTTATPDIPYYSAEII